MRVLARFASFASSDCLVKGSTAWVSGPLGLELGGEAVLDNALELVAFHNGREGATAVH